MADRDNCHLWQQLKNEAGVRFLFTRRLNQDALENFFGCVRQQSGNADNPTPIQFVRSFRKLFSVSVIGNGTGNCTADLDELLLKAEDICQSDMGKKISLDLQTKSSSSMALSSDLRDYRLANKSFLQSNSESYVAGYVLKKCYEKHKCENCADLASDELDDDCKLLTHFKSYSNVKGIFGGLLMPAMPFLMYFCALESVFAEMYQKVLCEKQVGQKIVNRLQEIELPTSCSAFPRTFLVTLFMRMRLYYTLKFKNRRISSSKRKNRKAVKVLHK